MESYPFILSHVTYKRHLDVLCSGHIPCEPHGDVHASLSYLIWDTERIDSLSSLIEMWQTKPELFPSRENLEIVLSFHPWVCAPCHQFDLGGNKRVPRGVTP